MRGKVGVRKPLSRSSAGYSPKGEEPMFTFIVVGLVITLVVTAVLLNVSEAAAILAVVLGVFIIGVRFVLDRLMAALVTLGTQASEEEARPPTPPTTPPTTPPSSPPETAPSPTPTPSPHDEDLAAGAGIDWGVVLLVVGVLAGTVIVICLLAWVWRAVARTLRSRRTRVAAWMSASRQHDAVIAAYAKQMFGPYGIGPETVLDDVSLSATAAFFTAWQEADTVRVAARPKWEALDDYDAAVTRLQKAWHVARFQGSASQTELAASK